MRIFFYFFFFNDTATTEIYTLSLHDALPIRSPCTTTIQPRCGASATPSQTASGASTIEEESDKEGPGRMTVASARNTHDARRSRFGSEPRDDTSGRVRLTPGSLAPLRRLSM